MIQNQNKILILHRSTKLSQQNGPPVWLEEFKQETLKKVQGSLLTQGCAQGNTASLFALMVGFAPFVYNFPKIIKSKYGEENESRGAQILGEMKEDEESHRKLWDQTCEVLAIDETQLGREPLPGMLNLIKFVGEDTKLYISFLRFMGVEIIAEALSKALMDHSPFKERLGKQGLAWFEVHLNAMNEVYQTSHEALTLQLARQHAGSSGTEAQFEQEVCEVIDLFIAAADECHRELALATL